ncbi:hypothetical protein Syun_031318 [Stephania yunnanensis]|uniref:Uncharacterized protein n=1 Tax=Stephania yunnanensis TaxID=152371 RepID=A0AAP0DW95_9MAGN
MAGARRADRQREGTDNSSRGEGCGGSGAGSAKRGSAASTNAAAGDLGRRGAESEWPARRRISVRGRGSA